MMGIQRNYGKKDKERGREDEKREK